MNGKDGKFTNAIMKKYKPISCDFYDELELLAMRKTPCQILFRKDAQGELQTIQGTINDLYTRNKEEFLLLSDSTEIRLDQLVSVNGKALKNYC